MGIIRLLILPGLFVMSFDAQANEFCRAGGDISPQLESGFQSFANQMKEYGAYAATESDVENAKCLNPGSVSLEKINQYFQNKGAARSVKKNLYGLELEDDPQKIELLNKLITVANHEPAGPKGQYGLMEQKNFGSSCKKVDCAAKEIFGSERGPKLLYAMDKYGANLSHLRFQNTRAWDNEEVDNVLEALDDLPSSLMPIKDDLMIARHNDEGGNTNKAVEPTIMFFKGIDKEGPVRFRYSLVHEIGHVVSEKISGDYASADQSEEWLSFSSWSVDNGAWSFNKKTKIPSVYGYTNPMEDYAESFAAYRYNPKEFKKMAPDKYAYMKDRVFMGLEYDKEENCQEDRSYFSQVSPGADFKEIESYPMCREEILSLIGGSADFEKMRKCVRESLRSSAIQKANLDLPPGVSEKNVKYSMERLGLNSAQKSPTDHEVLSAFKIILSDMKNSYVENYSDFSPKSSPCSDQKSSGQYHFTDFFENKTEDKEGEAIYRSENSKVLKEFSFTTCKLLKKPKKIKGSEKEVIQLYDELLEGL